MRIDLHADYQPSPGATMTAAALHAMVDNATLHRLEDSEIISGGSILAASPASGSHGFMVFAEQKLVWAPQTTVSLVGGNRHWFGKTYPAWYYNENGYQPIKGLPCLVPNDFVKTRGGWSLAAATSWSAGGWWNMPRITQDNILWFEWYSKISATKYSASKYLSGYWGVVDKTQPAQNGLVQVLEHGFGQAFVHASMSSNLSAPGIYGILYNEANNDHFPVATIGISPADEAATIPCLPLGQVRKVYTESGITLVPYVFENEASATNVPYFVAEIFFGGFGCL